MENRHIKWLYKQLPQLEARGVITADTAESIRRHYAQQDRQPKVGVALVVCGVLGALLIGGGIILLLAHNWQELARPGRTVVAIAPLVVAHILAFWSTATGRNNIAWREGVAIFMTLSVAASIAIIGQTYNVPGNLASYLLTWMLLTAPVVYLLRAVGTCVMYLAGITGWAVSAQVFGGQALLFWVLLALILPFVWMVSRNRYTTGTALVGWALSICVCIAAGVTMERVVPGLWIVVYASLFAIFYLVGGYWFADAPSDWQRPYFVTGAGGIAGLSLLFTFAMPWENIGWHSFRHAPGIFETAAVFDYAAAVVLPAAAIALLVTAVRRGEAGRLLYGVMPLLAISGFLAGLRGWAPVWQMAVFNLYMFVLGAGTIAAGIGKNRMAIVNGGMVVLSALILVRFFDSDLGLAARGMAFIAIGIGFLAVNTILVRKQKKGVHA
uniref:DUF2157 domain-containing protein n=1 Tax=uncultured organism TaxID=155900 RepID=M1QBB9_9ZZZZ|nr:conserved hypothetical protein, membrane [uncultured organism]